MATVRWGVSVDVVHASARSARYVIAQINEQMPFTMGDSFIHLNEIDAAYVASQPLPELQPAKMDPVTQKIGEYAALLIEDGATLQMGIGKIPDAVLICDRSDDDKIVVHHFFAVHPVTGLHKCFFCLTRVHQNHIDITVLSKLQGLPCTDGNRMNPDSSFFFKKRMQMIQ